MFFLILKLNGKTQLEYFHNRGSKIANIICTLAGLRWGAHPSSLLTVYRSLFRSSLEYGCHITRFHNNSNLISRLQKLQNKVLRSALGFRCSTPINVILDEAKEPPFTYRFSLLTTRYLIKQFFLQDNPVISSLFLLYDSVRHKRSFLEYRSHIFILDLFLKHKHLASELNCSILPSAFNYSFLLQSYSPNISYFDHSKSDSLSNNQVNLLP